MKACTMTRAIKACMLFAALVHVAMGVVGVQRGGAGTGDSGLGVGTNAPASLPQPSWQNAQLTKELESLMKELANADTAAAKVRRAGEPLQDARQKAAISAIEDAIARLRGGGPPPQEALVAAQRALELLRERGLDTVDRVSPAGKVSHFAAGGRAGATSRAPPPPTCTMIKEDLDLSRFPTAVCNDGSRGAYYISEAKPQQGHPAAPNIWLVFLQGGGWCWDEASCAARFMNERGLMSSEAYPPTRQATGIFSPDPELSPFATANKVYVPYCSSDAFAGNIGSNSSSISSDRWHFRGQDLVKATLQMLQMRARNPLAKGHVLYFGGCSAGGRGAMFNFEYLHEIVPKGVRYIPVSYTDVF